MNETYEKRLYPFHLTRLLDTFMLFICKPTQLLSAVLIKYSFQDR